MATDYGHHSCGGFIRDAKIAWDMGGGVVLRSEGFKCDHCGEEMISSQRVADIEWAGEDREGGEE